jgi:predicted ATP-binding protein involved in virulence
LSQFGAFAIVATHSAIVTREVPRDRVQVIRIAQGNIPIIEHPSFQTFGADITRIINYVFDNPINGSAISAISFKKLWKGAL